MWYWYDVVVQDWNSIEIDEQGQFTVFLQPLPRCRVMEASTAQYEKFIFVGKLALFRGGGKGGWWRMEDTDYVEGLYCVGKKGQNLEKAAALDLPFWKQRS